MVIFLHLPLWAEWVKCQHADPFLSSLLNSVLPVGETKSVAHGYFLQDDLLVRKCVPCGGDIVSEPLFQIVVLEKFREMV